MKFKFLKASVAGLIFSASCLANAGLINVDFQGGNNTYGGQGVLGSASDTVWNPVANSGTSLLFSDGSGASSISVSVSGFTVLCISCAVSPPLEPLLPVFPMALIASRSFSFLDEANDPFTFLTDAIAYQIFTF